jgi:hypothetical protein
MKAIDNLIGKRVIIRANSAGVFYGTLNEVEPVGNELQVELRDLRRLWYWEGACSLTQLAMEGVKFPEKCKFTIRQTSAVLIGIIEIILCTEAACNNIESVPEWKS